MISSEYLTDGSSYAARFHSCTFWVAASVSTACIVGVPGLSLRYFAPQAFALNFFMSREVLSRWRCFPASYLVWRPFGPAIFSDNRHSIESTFQILASRRLQDWPKAPGIDGRGTGTDPRHRRRSRRRAIIARMATFTMTLASLRFPKGWLISIARKRRIWPGTCLLTGYALSCFSGEVEPFFGRHKFK
jgi:hypothetical protein